tara:strand:- start:272 stop:910 length:639 start_codon:yes stop_codon:yes gene_type:complete
MAANEHKNLTDVNRHNPLGFENATNETVLSKDIGTSATETDGSLVWQKKSLMGVNNYKMQGYLTGATNYFYGEDIADTKSPFEMAVDYGNSAVASDSLLPSEYFRIGQSITIPEISKVVSITGWLTSNNNRVVTIALCKITPVSSSASAVVPIVIDEVAVTGLSSNNKLVAINETTISTPDLAVGDIIFPMVKEATAGSTIYMNINIQTTTF